MESSESTPKTTCQTLLKIMTKKEHVLFTTRCNKSIEVALKVASEGGRSHLLQQEDGGWLTYEKYGKAAGLEVTKMITLDGVVPPKELLNYGLDEVLIVNSLAGYIVPLDMDEIEGYCLQQDIFLINDVSGSIGTKNATQGDIVVGSFGNAKPVDLGEGGFIATNNIDFFNQLKELVVEAELDFVSLEKILNTLHLRRKFLEEKAVEVRTDLKDFAVVHPDAENALNVVVRFDSPEEKQKLTDYCDSKNLEYTVCPREIRILDDAVSIEVKRLVQ